jgi:hypothetical protein
MDLVTRSGEVAAIRSNSEQDVGRPLPTSLGTAQVGRTLSNTDRCHQAHLGLIALKTCQQVFVTSQYRCVNAPATAAQSNSTALCKRDDGVTKNVKNVPRNKREIKIHYLEYEGR